MKLNKYIAGAILLGGLCTSSQAITIGADATDRAYYDSYSNFSMILLDYAVPADHGDITEWETFIDSPSTGGEMALLFLKDLGGNSYETKFVDFRTASQGLNSFTASGTLEPGWIMGIWMGDAKVSFGSSTDPTTYTPNLALGSAPSVGDTISYTGTITSRVYSINATVDQSSNTTVPDGGSSAALLLLSGVGLFAAKRRLAVRRR